MLNINLHKSHNVQFCSYRLWDINIVNFWPWKFRSRSHGRKCDLWRSIANMNLHKSHTEHFCAGSYRLRYINIFNRWPWKFRSILCLKYGTYVVQMFECVLQMLLHNFSSRPTYEHERILHTHTYIHTSRDSINDYWQNLKADLPKN